MSYYPSGIELSVFLASMFVLSYLLQRAGYIDKLIDKQREFHNHREQNRWPSK